MPEPVDEVFAPAASPVIEPTESRIVFYPFAYALFTNELAGYCWYCLKPDSKKRLDAVGKFFVRNRNHGLIISNILIISIRFYCSIVAAVSCESSYFRFIYDSISDSSGSRDMLDTTVKD